MDERIGDQFTNEAQLQQLLINAINSDTLSDIIEDTAGLEEFNFDSDENQFPNFSIDYISRMAAMQAGKNCLRSLSILVRLTEDQNVSLERHESLRPDIICINPEEHSIVLFELKKSSHTGRQSLTELLAYEHEVRNYLPLLSDYDFNFILISSEWTTLMEHAASSAISWSGKKLLCLKAGLDNGVLKLKTHVPKAWHITGSVYLPETALPCVTVCLYRKDAYAQNENIENQSEEPDKKLSASAITAPAPIRSCVRRLRNMIRSTIHGPIPPLLIFWSASIGTGTSWGCFISPRRRRMPIVPCVCLTSTVPWR